VQPGEREVAEMNAAALKQIPLFATLSKHELKAAAQLADEIDVKEGEHLAEEGRFAHEFFAIQDGKADVIHGDKVIAQLGPGDFFGEIALVKTDRRIASVVATTPMKLVVIFGPNFNSLASSMPNVKEKIDAAIEVRCADM
jgi:CRP/FNR family transcriptional regulator, cyclic AMP receptor protein